MSSVIRNRNNVKSGDLMPEEHIVFRPKRSTADGRFTFERVWQYYWWPYQGTTTFDEGIVEVLEAM